MRFNGLLWSDVVTLHTAIDSQIVQPVYARVLFQRDITRFCLYSDRLSGVLALLLWGGPLAIVRLIAAIVVFPFKRRSGRARPHICEESAKAFAPSVAHENPARAIVPIRLGADGVAAFPRADPGTEFLGDLPWLRISVGGLSCGRSIDTKTPAALGMPRPELLCLNNTDCSAVASALPC